MTDRKEKGIRDVSGFRRRNDNSITFWETTKGITFLVNKWLPSLYVFAFVSSN